MLNVKYLYACSYKYCLDNSYQPKNNDYFITTNNGVSIKINSWTAPNVAEPTIDFLLDYLDQTEADTYLNIMNREFTYDENDNAPYINLVRALLVRLGELNPDQWIKDNI